MAFLPARHTALIVVDVQKAFEELEAAGRQRNNPDAVKRIKDILADFRAKGALIIHVRHASRDHASPLRHDRPGYAVQDQAREQAGETVLVKQVNSSFIGTDLEARLRERDIKYVVIVGATTNHCVETTARMAGNLGFEVKLVRDATWTFDLQGVDGEHFAAEHVHAMTLANLHREFAEIVTAEDILRRLRTP
jgi:nicotinamidase-related amidase